MTEMLINMSSGMHALLAGIVFVVFLAVMLLGTSTKQPNYTPAARRTEAERQRELEELYQQFEGTHINGTQEELVAEWRALSIVMRENVIRMAAAQNRPLYLALKSADDVVNPTHLEGVRRTA